MCQHPQNTYTIILVRMSEAYAGKSNKQIIEENAAALGVKSSSRTGDDFHPRKTVLSEQQDGVNKSGVDDFPGAEIHVGRTGQTGGGTNVSSQLLTYGRSDAKIHGRFT